MRFILNGIDKSNIFDGRSLTIDNTIGERSIASFVLKYDKDNDTIRSGTPFELFDDSNNKIFSGLLDEPSFSSRYEDGKVVASCSGVDNNARADNRLASLTFVNQTAGYIVNELINQVLSQEGIVAGNIETGPILEKVVFPYVPVSDALDELAEITGLFWNIDYDKQLHFYYPSTTDAPLDIDNDSKVFGVKLKRSKSKYRNKQIIRGGQAETDVLTERFAGDTERQTFTVGYPIAKVPTVYVNDVLQSVGIRGLEDNKDYYWAKNEKEITQDDSLTPLTTSDVLKVEYIGYFPVIAELTEPTAVDDRQALEGGSGLYENLIVESKIDNANYALNYAEGKLRKYGIIREEITLSTHLHGFEPGQRIYVNLPQHHLDGDYLIESVNANQIMTDKLEYQLTLVNGEPNHKWEHFFKEISKSDQALSIRENETLLLLVTLVEREGWRETTLTPAPQAQTEKEGWNETQESQAYACPIPGDDKPYFVTRRQINSGSGLYPSETLYPC